jgi:WD40 repeat protein
MQNILIKSHPPEEWWIKLSDFGISKRVEESPVLSLTLQGTPGYIAPELWGLSTRGSPYSTDIWAAGEIAFQIMTKKPTFAGVTFMKDYVMQRDQFPTDTLLDTGVSPLGVDFVFALMQSSPGDRLTAEVALSHGWIESLAPGSPILNEPVPGEKPNERPTPSSVAEEAATLNTKASLNEKQDALLTINSMTEDLASLNTRTSVQPLDSVLMGQASISNRDQRETMTTGSSDDTIRLCKTFDFHRGTPWAITFSLNEKVVAFATNQGHITLWDIEGGVEIRLGSKIRQSSRDSHFKTIALSPDGRLLATGTDQGQICVWDVLTGSIIQEKNFRIKPPGVTNCSFSPHGDSAAFALSNDQISVIILRGDNSGYVRNWSAATGISLDDPKSPYHEIFVPASHDSFRIKDLAYPPHDESKIVYTSGKRFWVRDLGYNGVERSSEYEFSSTEMPVAEVSADGRYMAYFNTEKKTIYVYETDDKSVICGIDVSYDPVRFKASPKVIGIAISSKTKILAAYVHYTIYDPVSASRIDAHDPIIFWNFETGEELYRIAKNGLLPFLPMKFSPLGSFFAFGSSGAKCELWTSDIGVYLDLLDKGDKEISIWDDLQEELD